MSEKEKMASILREKERIDYKVLNESGEIRLKSSSLDNIQSNGTKNLESGERPNKYTSPSVNDNPNETDISDVSNQLNDLKLSKSASKNITQQEIDPDPDLKLLKSKYDVLKDEIEDYIDENLINHTIVSVGDIESCIDKITDLRTQFRQTVKEIQNSLDIEQFNSQFADEIALIYACIKEYIINAKDRKSQIRMKDKEISDLNTAIKLRKDMEGMSQKRRATDFFINEVNLISNELSTEFEKECDGQVTDDEISRRKEDLPANLLKMEQLSAKFQKCLETMPDDYEDKDAHINSMSAQYNELVQNKESYEKFIQNEIREREISKEKSFQITSLNIKLSKFSGYESEMDIYTFQYEFDKLHLRTTPKKMLSDLLKYNYLEEPAL